MPGGDCHFEEIAMRFVGELSESEAFHTILVVTDWLTKGQHYILVKTTWTVEDIANSDITDFWKPDSLRRQITSGWGSQFASQFLKELNWQVYINLCLSTAYHSQTVGLTKQAVQTRKQYLHIDCHDLQIVGEHANISQNLSIRLQLWLSTNSSCAEGSKASIYMPSTLISTTNSLLLLQKNASPERL